jgi:hypothetical protein
LFIEVAGWKKISRPVSEETLRSTESSKTLHNPNLVQGLADGKGLSAVGKKALLIPDLNTC